MPLDRETTTLASAVACTAVVFGLLVSAVDLPVDSATTEPAFGAFEDRWTLTPSYPLLLWVASAPSNAMVSGGVVSVPQTTVVVTAGDRSATLTYRRRADDRTAAVPAGGMVTGRRTLGLGLVDRSAPTDATLESGPDTLTVHGATLDTDYCGSLPPCRDRSSLRGPDTPLDRRAAENSHNNQYETVTVAI
jgi:hypothetical protein